MSHEKILNHELMSLVTDYFEKEDVSQEFRKDIFNGIFSADITKVGKTKMEFHISGLEQQVDFTIMTEPPGRIFELLGTNQRFKTTSLIMIAIILNYNFGDAEDMLSSDQLLTRVTQLQKILFTSNNATFKFYIENEMFFYKFEKLKDKVTIEFTGGTKEIKLQSQDLFNNAFTEYQDFIYDLELAEVQFVSKGRNFVGFVHKQIRDEFVDTLDAIKGRLENTVTDFMNNLPPDYQATKSELEVKNEIVYTKKSLELLNKINISLPKLNNLTQLPKWNLSGYTLIQLKEMKTSMNTERKLIEEEIRVLNVNKETGYTNLKKHCNSINEYASNTPYTFEVNNLLYAISQFINEWDKLYYVDDLAGLINSNNKGDNFSKLATFTANSYFFGSMKVQTVNDFEKLLEQLLVAQQNLLKIRDYIKSNHGKIEEIYTDLAEIENKLGINNSKVLELNDDLREIEEIIELIQLFSLGDREEPIKDVFENIINTQDVKLFKLLDQYLDRINIGYNDENKEDLKMILQKHLVNLESILEKSSKTFVLPKKIKDIGFMTKFIQDLTAVIEFLYLDDRNYNEDIVKASMSTLVHDEIIRLFNRYMAERCKYYFEVKSSTDVVIHDLLNYDFEKKEFLIEGKTVSTSEGISGGTDSAMTVRSFASKKTNTKLGVIMLVDEWGDVGAELASKVYDRIIELSSFGLGIFVKVDYKLDKVALQYMR